MFSAVHRLAAALAIFVLLLGQAWAGPPLRAPARPCCCKPGEAAQASVARAKCCGQAERAQAPTRVMVRATAAADDALVAVASAPVAPALPPPPSVERLVSDDHPPDHGLGRGLPYRLRV